MICLEQKSCACTDVGTYDLINGIKLTSQLHAFALLFVLVGITQLQLSMRFKKDLNSLYMTVLKKFEA